MDPNPMEALALLRMEESVVGILKKQKDEVRCLLRNAGMKRNAVLVDTCLLSQVTRCFSNEDDAAFKCTVETGYNVAFYPRGK